MLEIIIILFLIIPAVLGMSEILHVMKMLILSPHTECNKYSLIVLENEDALFLLKKFFEENNWNGSKKNGKAIVVFKNLTGNIYEECKAVALNNGAVITDYEKIAAALE